MMSRRGMSSGGGASSLGYLFGSEATTLARPNNRAPPRAQQPSVDSNRGNNRDNNQEYTGLSNSKHQEFENDATGSETPTGCQTPSGYHTPGTDSSSSGHRYNRSPGNYLPQTRAAGKVTNDGGGVSLDMSGGSYLDGNNYLRADGPNSGNFITGRPSIRVAPGGGSSLGYLFGGA